MVGREAGEPCCRQIWPSALGEASDDGGGMMGCDTRGKEDYRASKSSLGFPTRLIEATWPKDGHGWWRGSAARSGVMHRALGRENRGAGGGRR